MRPPARVAGQRWPLMLRSSLAIGAVVAIAACSPTGVGSWTFDPTIGQATAGPSSASSPAGSPVESPQPSASSVPGQPSAGASSSAGLSLTAKNVAFSTSQLAAPASKPFTITFDNEDTGVPHNVAIYSSAGSSNVLFRGTIVTGPTTTTYDVPALPPGTYHFQCDVHPQQMNGTIVIG